MSISGTRRLELEAQHKEALRRMAVRAECRALDEACDQALRSVRDVAVQQLAASELRSAVQQLASARALVADRPDEALVAFGAAQSALHTAIARGESAARSWSAARAETMARARALVERAAAIGPRSGGDAATERAAEVLRRAEAGDVDGVAQLLPEAEAAIADKRSAVLDETVRKEIVRGLLTTLKSMGFVAQPVLHEGVVVLDGRLASGRRARFEVNLDGRMAFDLDGYEGRACKDDLDKVETALRDTYGVKLGPTQVEWKNPDRLSRDARSLPTTEPGKKRG